MQRTKIEWTDYVWNPIKGICPVGCFYCYARGMYKRFKWDERVRFIGSKMDSKYEMFYWETPAIIKNPARIFVCSTFEIFHPVVLSEWRDEIFRRIELFPQHIFIILTKMPENIDRPMPDNVWLGVSVTEDKDIPRIYRLYYETKAEMKFISFEPLLGEIFQNYPNGLLCGFKWIIIGRLTGHGHSHDPKYKTIRSLVNIAQGFEIPVFLKENLRDIWNGPLIKEFPK